MRNPLHDRFPERFPPLLVLGASVLAAVLLISACIAMLGPDVELAVQGGVKCEFNAGLVLRRRLTVTGSTLRPRSAAFKAALAQACRRVVWPLIEAGRIKPVIHSTFDAADAARAHALMESNQHVGKIVLTWGAA